jgi:hypothetical protein
VGGLVDLGCEWVCRLGRPWLPCDEAIDSGGGEGMLGIDPGGEFAALLRLALRLLGVCKPAA